MNLLSEHDRKVLDTILDPYQPLGITDTPTYQELNQGIELL